MKLLDVISIIIVLSIGLIGIYFSSQSKAGAFAEISTPYGEYRYPLSKDKQIKVRGKTSEYSFEIHNGKIHATYSACPYQHCLHKGEIHRQGDSIICVPEQVVCRIVGNVEIENSSASNAQLDAISE